MEAEEIANLFKRAQNISYIFELVETKELHTGKKRVRTSKVWVKGNNIRIEYISAVPNLELPPIFPGAVHIFTEEGKYYVYNPDNNSAVDMTPWMEFGNLLAKKRGISLSNLDHAFDLFDFPFPPSSPPKEIEIAGEEEVEGKVCLVLKKKGEKEEATVWIWKEYGIPLRWVSKGKGGKTTTAEVKNLKIEPVSQSMFELPPGVEIKEIAHKKEKVEVEGTQLTFTDFTELRKFAEDVTGKAFGRYIEAYRGGRYMTGGKRYETISFKSAWDEVKSKDRAGELILKELKKRGIKGYKQRAGRMEVVVPNVRVEEKTGTLYFVPLCVEGSNCGMQVDFEYRID